MYTSYLTALVLGFCTLVHCSITFPTANTRWGVGEEHNIEWDMASVDGPLDMYLANAGSIDISTSISISTGISNTGSFPWSPSADMPSGKCKIIAVDKKRHQIFSSIFVIVIINGGGIQTMSSSPPIYANTTSAIATIATSEATTASTTQVLTPAIPIGTAPPTGNGSFSNPSATTGSPQSQFTGAASKATYSLALGGLIGAIAIFNV